MPKSTPLTDFQAKVKDELEKSQKPTLGGKAGISPSTIKNYISKLRVLQKEDALTDYFKWVKSKPMTEASQITYNSNVLGLIKHSPTFEAKYGHLTKALIERQKEITDQRKKRESNAKATEEEMKKLLNHEDWSTAMLKARGQDKLILQMYSLIPPRRGDYFKVKLIHTGEDEPKEDNYLNVDTMELTIDPIKSGEVSTIKLPPKLEEAIRSSLQSNLRRYLFVNSSGNPFTNPDSFTRHIRKMLEKLTGRKGLGIQAIRNYVISTFHKGGKTLTELKEFAQQSGHSVEMSQLYRKF